MSIFLASPATLRSLRDDSRSKVLTFSPSIRRWDLSEVLEFTGLLETYRTVTPQPRVIPLIPALMMRESESLRAVGRLLCASDILFYGEDDADISALKDNQLEVLPAGLANARGPTTLHAYRVPLSGPAATDAISQVETILRAWVPWRYMITMAGTLAGPIDEIVAHCRRYLPSLLGCREEAEAQALRDRGVDAQLYGGHGFQALRHLLHEMTLEARPSGRDKFAIQIGEPNGVAGNDGKHVILQHDLKLLWQQYRGGAGPVILDARAAKQAADAEVKSLLAATDHPDGLPSFTFIGLVAAFVRDRLVAASEELQRCDRLVALDENVKLLGDVLHIPSLLLPGLGSAAPDGSVPVQQTGTVLEAFLSNDRAFLLRDQQRLLLREHEQSESWRTTLAGALQAPYEDRGWVIRADARANALEQELVEYKRRAVAAEQRLAGRNPDDVARLEEEVQTWQMRYQQQEVQLATMRRELDLVFRTRSWRITRPLRGTYEWVAQARSTGLLRTLILSRALLPKPAKDALARLASLDVAGVPKGIFPESFPLAPEVLPQVRWNPKLPLVSVIIPCYNYGQYVEEAVGSVLRQELHSVEIIVVDDGSTDPHTIEVLDRLDLPRTRLIRKANGGLADARNSGIAMARGKYICCLDADDTIEPTYLEKSVSLLEANRGVSFTYTWARLFGDESKVWYTEPFDLERLLQQNHITAAGVFARVAWEQVGGYRPEMRFGYEDWDFWLRLAERGMRGQLIPEALFNHRRHGRTMTHDAHDMHLEIVEQIRSAVPVLFGEPEAASRIRQIYFDQRVRPAFLNLSDNSRFRQRDIEDQLLMLVPWLPSGGAELVLYQAIRGMRDLPIEHHIMSTVPAQNEWHDLFYEHTKNIYHLPNFLLRDAWKDFLFNYVEVKKINKVLVSASEFGYTILPELKQRFPNIKVYNLLHNDTTLGYFRHSVGYDDCIDVHIAVSGKIGDKLIEIGRVDREKVRVIYNGVDVEHAFNPANYSVHAVRQQLGLPAKKIISFIGRLSVEKRPLEFLRIASKLGHRKDVHFVIVGTGPQADEVHTSIDELGLSDRLTWYAGLPPAKIPEILAVTSLLAVTSAAEGFPFVVLEALAMGVAVTSYDVGEVYSAVLNGINGWIVEPDSTDEFAAALDHLLGRPEILARFRERARPTLIQQGFTLQTMVAQYRELLMPAVTSGASAVAESQAAQALGAE